METYDLMMLVVLVGATLFGFWKGMAWQIASLASLILSYTVALKFSDQLAPKFGDSAPWNRFVAMLVIYIATSFVIWTLFRLVSGVIDRVKLNGFDHQMGALIGAAKGVLLCVAITFFAVTLLPQQQKETIIASRAGKYIVLLLDKTDSVVPPEIHQVLSPYIDRIEQRLDPSYTPDTMAPFGLDGQNVGWPTQAPAPSAWPESPPAADPNAAWPQQAQGESNWPQ